MELQPRVGAGPGWDQPCARVCWGGSPASAGRSVRGRAGPAADVPVAPRTAPEGLSPRGPAVPSAASLLGAGEPPGGLSVLHGAGRSSPPGQPCEGRCGGLGGVGSPLRQPDTGKRPVCLMDVRVTAQRAWSAWGPEPLRAALGEAPRGLEVSGRLPAGGTRAFVHSRQRRCAAAPSRPLCPLPVRQKPLRGAQLPLAAALPCESRAAAASLALTLANLCD